MKLDPIETLRRLVAIPSVNPMGGPADGPDFLEARLTEHLEGLLQGLGLPCQRQTVAPGRDNLVARLEGDPTPKRGGSVLLLEAHQDTVPVHGMTIPPFSPEVRAGRLYGRGACDVKGGMAAMICALARLAEELPRPRPTLYFAATVNEEHGFTGAAALADCWSTGPNEVFVRKPDAAIVAEPTELDVVVAHKGVVRWRCHARGRAAHSAQPEQGENAIYRMGRAIGLLEQYAGETVGTLASHPLCGRPTLSVGLIHGGTSVNTVPDRCTIEIDRRLVPGEKPLDAWRHAVDYLAGNVSEAARLEHEPPFLQAAPLVEPAGGALAAELGGVAAEVAGRGRPIGVPYATNAACYAGAGVPAVVFGPGSICQAHTADEWIALEQVELAAEILVRAVRAFPTGPKSRGPA